MATSFLTGQRLTADLLNNNVTAFMPTTVSKASATSRNTTTTLTNDTELTGISLGVGTWEVEVIGFWTQVTSTTQKIKTRWAFTGTWSGTAVRSCIGAGSAQVAAPETATDVTVAGRTLDTQDSVYNQSTSTVYGTFREISRTVVVTVAGTMSLQWAQSVSSANNTTLQSGSSITIRKIL